MREDLDRLPLDEQLAHLTDALEREEPGALLARVATLRDAEPLVRVCAALVARGWLLHAPRRAQLVGQLLDRPDTALDRVLRALPPAPGLALLLEELLEPLPPARIATIALVDRVLRRADPEAWRRRLTRLEREAVAAVAAGETPTAAQLCRLPGVVLRELRGLAERAGGVEALDAALADLTTRVYAALAAAPKALSQSNAEALLSQQVYTEPGHFLIELLQNAVDSGARAFSVRFEERRVLVWHDGAPFDARDVVGVCSIGQTTKRQDQIGFFGVGFKSVYEVTERPRVYSGGWCFEIADVSVPRPLGGRPPELPPEGTVIVLPLRPDLDRSRRPEALYRQTERLDPCLLLTLPGIESLSFFLENPAQHRTLRREALPGALRRIREEPGGLLHHHRVHTWQGPPGENGRPGALTLGLPCDAEGLPAPLPPGATSVYSYLPTEERSGLRFWVQAHFEVPVDRERVQPESAWNQGLIGAIPALLAASAAALPPAQRPALAAILPLSRELTSPLWRPVATGLAAAFHEVPLLPDTDGIPRPAATLIVAEPAIVALFGGEVLDGALFGGTGLRGWLHPEAPERSRALARELGALALDAADLLDAVEDWLEPVPDGALPTDEALPAWIRRAEPLRMVALARLLRPVSPTRVARIPLLPGDAGGLHRVGALRMAEGSVRALLSGLVPLSHPALDADDEARATLTQLGVRIYHAVDAVAALERLLAPRTTLPASAAPLDPRRVRLVWRCLAEAPPVLCRRALALPLVLCEDGSYHTGQDDALRAPPGPFTNALRVLYGTARPLAVDDEDLEAWLSRAGAESLDLETLLMDLGGCLVPEAGRIQPLHAALAGHWRTLPSYVVDLLVKQPLWPTVSGDWLPLERLVDAPALLRICAPDTPERRMLDAQRVEGSALDAQRALAPVAPPASAVDLARRMVRALLREGEGPAAQVPLLRDHRAALREILPPEDPDAPLLDATGRLRRGPLRHADPETRALLRGHPIEAQLVAEGEPTPPNRVLPLTPAEALRALAERGAGPALWDWILHNEAALAADPEGRAILADAPLVRSVGGAFVPARELVLDAELPALGIALAPDPTVPEALLRLLTRQLGTGGLSPEELVRRHLRPAYEGAEPARARLLLAAIVARVQPLGAARVRALLQDLPLPDQQEVPTPAGRLLVPAPRIAAEIERLWPTLPRPHPAVFALMDERMLGLLGARALPEDAALRETLQDPGTLARALDLCTVLESLEPATLARLEPGGLPWLPDGAGRLRRPRVLYLRTPELEALIGEDPALYPLPEAAARLGTALLQELGAGGVERVGVDEVIAHIARQAEAGRPVPARVYEWLDEALASGRLSAALLRDRLAQRPWIPVDDGRRLPAERVLGFPALHLFGLRRGSWSQGARRYPALAEAFGVETELKPAVIVAFLEEIAAEQARDEALLTREPGLPRLLLACFDQLGRMDTTIPRSLRVLPAVAARGGPTRLLAAESPGLYRSDTPTLEALFAAAGPLWLCARGERDQTEGVERFLTRMEVPSLRGAWRARPEPGGQDRTAARGAELSALRAIVRALGTALPRVRAWRTQLQAEGWRYPTRLRDLAFGGPIRAVEDLRVRMDLPGVGQALAPMDAVRDPDSGTLLVEDAVLRALPRAAARLAEGLLACVYEGPGEDQLVEILEILLPLAEEEAMHAYLDRRHFPTVARPEEPGDRLRARVSEILDFGVAGLLAQRFEALRGADTERWRDPALLAALPPEPALAAGALLRAIGAPERGPAAEELSRLLAAKELRELNAAPPEPVRWKEPTPVVTRAPPPLPPPAPPTWFDRLRQSLFGAGAPAEPRNPFTPRDVLTTAFWATPEAQRASVPSQGRLEHQPTPLPAPYRYAIDTLGVSFDSARQSWRSAKVPVIAGEPTAFVVSFTGTLPPGLCRLPIPIHAVLDEPPHPLPGEVGSVDAPQPSGAGWSILVRANGPLRVRYTVRLTELPTLGGPPPALPALLQPTLPTTALPAPVQRWLAGQDRTAPLPERARAVERFVLANYAYDHDYLSRPAVVAARGRLRAGQGNHLIEVLHAGAGEGLLGRGMCSELNALVVELCRQVGVPAAMAGGWMLDLGWLEKPDHLFALALMPTPGGACWMPLDAARSHDGGAVPSPAPRGMVAPPREGLWTEAPAPASDGPIGIDEQLRATVQLLERALTLSHLAQGRLPPDTATLTRGRSPTEAIPALRLALEASLPRPTLVAPLLALVRGDLQGLEQLPPEVRELEALGLARVEQATTWRARPTR